MKTIKLTFKVIWHFEKLLDKNANTRLGSPSSPHGEIIENPFFHEIDWKKLERRQLESPFKPEIVRKTSFFFHFVHGIKKPVFISPHPFAHNTYYILCASCHLKWSKMALVFVILQFQKHPLDTNYFDRAYTREKVRLPLIEREQLKARDQEKFKEFSYTNPNVMAT